MSGTATAPINYAVPFMESAKNTLFFKKPVAGSDLASADAVRIYEFSIEQVIGNGLAFMVGAFVADIVRTKSEKED